MPDPVGLLGRANDFVHLVAELLAGELLRLEGAVALGEDGDRDHPAFRKLLDEADDAARPTTTRPPLENSDRRLRPNASNEIGKAFARPDTGDRSATPRPLHELRRRLGGATAVDLQHFIPLARDRVREQRRPD